MLFEAQGFIVFRVRLRLELEQISLNTHITRTALAWSGGLKPESQENQLEFTERLGQSS